MTGVTRRWVAEGGWLGTTARRIETWSPRTPSTGSTGREQGLNHGISRSLNGQEIRRRKSFRGPISKVDALVWCTTGCIWSICPERVQELFQILGPLKKFVRYILIIFLDWNWAENILYLPQLLVLFHLKNLVSFEQNLDGKRNPESFLLYFSLEKGPGLDQVPLNIQGKLCKCSHKTCMQVAKFIWLSCLLTHLG